jgi:uncharacterized protein
MRIFRGRHGWWLRTTGKVVLLPSDAVGPDLMLTAEATVTLEEKGVFAHPEDDTYYVTLLTSTDCNLGCGYCFQNTGQAAPTRHNPPRIASTHLNSGTTTAALKFVEDRMRSASASKLHVLLFGGEPLLNPQACLQVLIGASELGLADAGMVSNGVLLRPSLARSLADAGLRQVKITFDGERSIHDRIRTTRNGRSTYDVIVRNIQDATATTPLMWDIRVNVSHLNANSVPRLIDDLAKKVEPGRCAFDFALVDDVSVGYRNDVAYSETFLRQLIEWHVQALEAGFDIVPDASLDHCPYCAELAGVNGAVISASGDLYSCWESAGRDGWAVGDVHQGYISGRQLTERWVACDFDRTGPKRSELQSFYDAVESAVLDWKYEHHRILSGPPPN